ncbi:S-layer homology domain-containing protein [Collinsella sp. zg1085]|uniref:GH25 family lysozyme n=1 Tax=Collinsella sp. zg1085 TaxID=2844380 RepID=UPI001C0C748F|nr:GH25 family lysozyme [Collinsella sp. zg1085]QWT17570.1 S-layer homology domain-containing protein [Collinsella sp. zg1085]
MNLSESHTVNPPRRHTSPTSRSQSRRTFLAGAAALTSIAVPIPVHALEADDLAHLSSYDDYVAWARENPQPDPASPAASLRSARPAPQAKTHAWIQSERGKTFLDGEGNVFASPATKVIDVSTFQGAIDWDRVKSSGVDAAILRCGYGVGNEDVQFRRNIIECKRVGMPYGIYLYSYAYDATFAAREGDWTAELLKRYDAKPILPIYYDLEKWSWTGHTPPSSPRVYEQIVQAYFKALARAGYHDVSVYSYTSYLNGPLNSRYIWDRTSWVAQYFPTLRFDIAACSPSFHGWQYTSSGTVDGIAGAVDVSAFTPFRLYGFSDVTHGTPHHEDIGWLKKRGIANGFPDGTFRGESSIARQDMAAMLYRTAGSPYYVPNAADMQRFSDVSPATPHFKEICWVGSRAIAEGWSDGTYRGLSHVARQDMAAFLYRIAGSPAFEPTAADIGRFPDVSESTPHCREIWWLARTGISTGFPDGTFRGLAPVARQDMAAFLHRLHTCVNGVFLS